MPTDVGGLSQIWSDVVNGVVEAAREAGPELATASEIVGEGAVDGIIAFTFADPVIDIGLLTVCAAFLLIALAFKWLVTIPLAWVVGFIPFVGAGAATVINNIGNWEWNTISSAAKGAWDGLWNFLAGIWEFVTGLIHAIPNTILHVAAFCSWLINDFVPAFLNEILGWVANQLSGVYGYINASVGGAIAYSQQLYNQAIGHANQLYNQAIGYIQQLYNQAIAHADQVGNALEIDLQRLDQGLSTDIADATQKVELEIGHAFTTAEDFTKTLVSQASAQLEQDITTGVAGAVAVATLAQSNLDKYLDNCGNVMCQSNGQNAKNVQNLSLNFGALAFFAFLYECIENPVPTADLTADILEPVAGLAGGLTNVLLGAVV